MQNVAFPMGHFYNPVPSDEDIEKFIANRRYDVELPGIDLNLAVQRDYYRQLMRFREGYMLRAFLQYNQNYEIIYWGAASSISTIPLKTPTSAAASGSARNADMTVRLFRARLHQTAAAGRASFASGVLL